MLLARKKLKVVEVVLSTCLVDQYTLESKRGWGEHLIESYFARKSEITCQNIFLTVLALSKIELSIVNRALVGIVLLLSTREHVSNRVIHPEVS